MRSAKPLADLLARSALEQAAAIRRREVSVEEMLRAYLGRIEERQPELQAFAQLLPRRALAAARRLDARAPAEARPPLWGLPTAMKDVHLARGTFTRIGSRAFRWMWSPVDDVTTRAVRATALVIVGKSTTSELALLPYIETDLQPPTRNPWDPSRTAGGSSGGSAAALASGMLPIAPGSDGAGSVRIPATFCGLVGHKPTRGLVPNPFRRFDELELSVVGPLARSVDDAAALLDALTGDLAPEGGFLRAARRPPAPLRIHFTTTAPETTVEPVVARGVARALAALRELGHTVEERPPMAGRIEEFLPIFRFSAARMLVPWEGALQPTTRWLRLQGRAVTPALARARRDEISARVDAWFGDADVWVTPTVASLPPKVGAAAGMTPADRFAAAAPLGAFTAPFNASGQPALSIPVRVEGEPLPLGVQLVGRRGADAPLLALGRALLEALGTPLLCTAA